MWWTGWDMDVSEIQVMHVRRVQINPNMTGADFTLLAKEML